ncbi:MAG TPA: hypothetical protein VEA80_03820 [Vitreimonas sp.]|uniref:cell division protein FtsL n=1 Tax=Vitreimonas sp. TaxID=3069702 RepID=UPI002D339BB3|nr:hypothetical protein [Vitreimonas sp.]HYD86578.1 hypothetical protein [Vitreimonas sp.]
MGKAQLIRMLQIIAAVVIVVLAVGLYRAKSDAARTQAHVRELQNEIEAREAALRELRAEIAERESPANVEQLAQDRLGVAPGSANATLPEGEIARRLPAPERAREPRS